MKRILFSALPFAVALFGSSRAHAQSSSAPVTWGATAPATSSSAAPASSAGSAPATAAPAPSSSAANPPPNQPVPANAPTRQESLQPHPLEPVPEGHVRFEADPVGDGAMLTALAGFDVLSEFVLSTGEVRPQQIDPSFDTQSLLSIDRGAISQNPDANAGTLSNIGLYTAVGFAVLDPI
ncbi:MAG: hypothetical protein ACRELY_28675, partial [Polyangiaceae bacterium]